MKKIYTIATLLLLCTQASFGQRQGAWCATDERFEQRLLTDPSLLFKRELQENNIREWIKTHPATNKGSGNPLYTIPIVVHVINDVTGGDIIDNATIFSGIATLNKDFRKENADTTNTRAIFKPYGADLELEFKLATIDPDGNCTNGITRTRSDETNDARDNIKSVSYWESSRYFNIWVVKSIQSSGGGITLGYAQFPGSGSPTTYGIVIRADQFSAASGRTLTHEMGHCVNLYHTHQGGCAGTCETSGDYVCDTPQESTSSSESSCNNTLNDCTDSGAGAGFVFSGDPPNPTENYMSYSDCQNMFTLGQKTRALASLATASEFSVLTSASNLINTGTAPGTVPKLCADFSVNSQFVEVCANKTISFEDETFGGTPTNWEWDFGDGIGTSTEQNPFYTYTVPGEYNVTLTASNSTDSSTVTKSEVIKINPISGGIISPIHEGFESKDFPSLTDPIKEWTVENGYVREWERTETASFSGGGSYALKLLSIPSGNTYNLISPTIDFSNTNCNNLKFQYAYSQLYATSDDQLNIYVSKNCGETWSLFYSKNGPTLSTTGYYIASNFIPTEEEWKQEEISLASFAGRDHILIKFEITTGNGNYFYIDDIDIGCDSATGINELHESNFTVYPNPTNSVLNVGIENSVSGQLQIEIKNTLGQVVYSGDQKFSAGKKVLAIHDFTHMEPGLYFIKVSNDKRSATKKIVKY